MHLIVLRIIQNVFVHLDKQLKLRLTPFGPSDYGCSLYTRFSVPKMHGEMTGISPGAAYNLMWPIHRILGYTLSI